MLILNQMGFDELIQKESRGCEERREEKSFEWNSEDTQHPFMKRTYKYLWEDDYFKNELSDSD